MDSKEGVKPKRFEAPTRRLFVAMALWSGAQFGLGDIWGMMRNSQCFKYFGCNAGFFGFDALVHFLAGILFIMFVLWLFHAYPKLNLLHSNFWKTTVTLLAIVALLGVTWEFMEFSADHIRIDILHENLIHPNRLAQPSNGDTMGDLTFALLGAALSISILKKFDAKVFEGRSGDCK